MKRGWTQNEVGRTEIVNTDGNCVYHCKGILLVNICNAYMSQKLQLRSLERNVKQFMLKSNITGCLTIPVIHGPRIPVVHGPRILIVHGPRILIVHGPRILIVHGPLKSRSPRT